VVRRIMEHAGKPATDYVRLSLDREALRRAFWPALAGVDAIVAPTIPLLPPRFDELVEDPAYFRLNALILRNTSPFNLLGCPAASVPCWRTPEGLSVGLMVVTRPGEEELALGIAKQVEERVASGVRAG
jgi:aspartyl-tRNA(Asn)/glutamyl-tRNA(Gln) amidotransferase subunit A